MQDLQVMFLNGGLKSEPVTLRFGDFTLSSGRGSDYFWNLGNYMNTGRGADLVGFCYATLMESDVRTEQAEFDFFFSPAYKGCALAPVVALHLAEFGLPIRFGYDIKEEAGVEGITASEALGNVPNIEVVDEVAVFDMPTEGAELPGAAIEYRNLVERYKFDFLLGETYSGIGPAVLAAIRLADKRDVRWGYQRKFPKGHGDPKDMYIVGNLQEGDRVLLVRGETEPTLQIVGDLREGDRIAMGDDVMTTGGSLKKGWNKMKVHEPEITPVKIYLGMDREECTLDGKSPKEEFKGMGFDVGALLGAREVFEYLKGREVNGVVLVDEERYASFQKRMEEFGV